MKGKKVADKITNFEDYKKRENTNTENTNTEEIDIQIEDPYNFFNEQEREEYFQERQKQLMSENAEEAGEDKGSEKDTEKDTKKDIESSKKEHIEPERGRRKRIPEVSDEDDEGDYDEDYDDEEYDEEKDEEEEPEDGDNKGGFPMELFIRISSAITGIVILVLLAIVAKVKIYDRYFAEDPDEVQEVVAALPAGFTEKNDTVTVTAQSLNLRSTASSESDATIVTSVSKGTQLKRIAVNQEGTWALVEYNGSQVYASMKYLSVNE